MSVQATIPGALFLLLTNDAGCKEATSQRTEAVAAAGVLERTQGWIATSWPVRDGAVEEALRARLGAAVHEAGRASLQDAILLELLQVLGVAHRVLRDDVGGMGRADLKRAIDAIAPEGPSAAALKVVRDTLLVTMIATMPVTGFSS